MALYGVAFFLQVRHIRKGGIKDVIIKRIDGVVVFAFASLFVQMRKRKRHCYCCEYIKCEKADIFAIFSVTGHM
jgi:hypothetical protein